jgi:hypothetical protein
LDIFFFVSHNGNWLSPLNFCATSPYITIKDKSPPTMDIFLDIFFFVSHNGNWLSPLNFCATSPHITIKDKSPPIMDISSL